MYSMDLFLVLILVVSVCLLFYSGAVSASVITPVDSIDSYTWLNGDTTFVYHVGRGVDCLEVTINDVTFQPFIGMGVKFAIGGRTYLPSQADKVVSQEKVVDGVLHIDYVIYFGNETCKYEVKMWVDADAFHCRFSSADTRARGISTGIADGLAIWRKLDITRLSELYAQRSLPQPIYSVLGDFFLFADWVVMDGNGSTYYYNSANVVPQDGIGPVKLAPDVEYHANTRGEYMNVTEHLTFRVDNRLWNVVPELPQQPSEFRDDLRDVVFLDLWGGTKPSYAIGLLQDLSLLTHNLSRFYTILQHWTPGNWDQYIPDNFRMPDIVPDSNTTKDIKKFIDFGKTLGYVGLRCNYVRIAKASPSYKAGVISKAMEADGSERWHIKLSQLVEFASSQQELIHRFFDQPNCAFTDETASAAVHSFLDYDPTVPGGTSARVNIEQLREFAASLRDITNGPVSAESLVSEFLLGEWIATGDYAIRDGHHRMFSPDYKLRRLHNLSVFHGMGLVYRFNELPPYSKRQADFEYYYGDRALLDDYRACTVLYGNGGYIFYQSENWPMAEMLTEILVVGQLQKHYAAVGVSDIYYRVNGKWLTLEDLYKEIVFNSTMLGQVRVEYENGLIVVVNRRPEEISVQTPSGVIVLPQYGWVAYKEDGSVLSYSAFFPGTTNRVDYFEDSNSGIRFINPRSAQVLGTDKLTLWRNGVKITEFDPVTGKATVNGKTVKLNTVK